ncbi:MAG: MFS transporter, partial [Nitrospirota bacterium]|nr:MFS transporter [Nitrospirota bacterium]
MHSHSDKTRKSLRYSIFDGSFAASMIGFGESFFMAFAVFLQANNIQLGLLSALPLLLGSLFQLASNRLISLFRTRKRLVSSMALSQGLMYIPILLVFFLGPQKLNYLIAFVCVYWILGMILSPAWNSWMGDLVDEKERGGYFGMRNKITGSASFLSFLAAGYILHLYSDWFDYEYLGFVTIFIIALCARIFSYIFLTMKYEPQYTAQPRPEFTFIDFIREARFRNYGRFVLYLSLMNFAVYLSVPFFVPYMLKDLQLDYMAFTIVNAAAIISKLLSMPVWGSASDRFG